GLPNSPDSTQKPGGFAAGLLGGGPSCCIRPRDLCAPLESADRSRVLSVSAQCLSEGLHSRRLLRRRCTHRAPCEALCASIQRRTRCRHPSVPVVLAEWI